MTWRQIKQLTGVILYATATVLIAYLILEICTYKPPSRCDSTSDPGDHPFQELQPLSTWDTPSHSSEYIRKHYPARRDNHGP